LITTLNSNDDLNEMESIYLNDLEKQQKYYNDREILFDVVRNSNDKIFKIKFIKTEEVKTIDKVIYDHIEGSVEGIQLRMTNNNNELRRIIVKKNELTQELKNTENDLNLIEENLLNWKKSDVSIKSCYINVPWKVGKGDFDSSGIVSKEIKEIIIRTSEFTDIEISDFLKNNYNIRLSSDLFRSINGVYFIMIDGSIYYNQEISEKLIEKNLKIVIGENLKQLIIDINNTSDTLNEDLEKSRNDLRKLDVINEWIKEKYLSSTNLSFYIDILKENSFNYYKKICLHLRIDFYN